MSRIRFRYLAISDREVCPESIPRRVERLMELGVPAVQIRDRSTPDRTRFEWVRSLSEFRRRLLINSRADIAALGGLSGVHRAGDALSIPELRSILGEGTVGVSTHDLSEAQEAEQRGADYVTFGPIFPTPSKPDRQSASLPGLEGLREVCERIDLPVLALGGVGPDRVRACRDAGAFGAAGIRALFEPPDPAPAWSRIRGALGR